jgi:hypothetical protein
VVVRSGRDGGEVILMMPDKESWHFEGVVWDTCIIACLHYCVFSLVWLIDSCFWVLYYDGNDGFIFGIFASDIAHYRAHTVNSCALTMRHSITVIQTITLQQSN